MGDGVLGSARACLTIGLERASYDTEKVLVFGHSQVILSQLDHLDDVHHTLWDPKQLQVSQRKTAYIQKATRSVSRILS